MLYMCWPCANPPCIQKHIKQDSVRAGVYDKSDRSLSRVCTNRKSPPCPPLSDSSLTMHNISMKLSMRLHFRVRTRRPVRLHG